MVYTQTDEEVKSRIVDQLYWDDRVDASHVGVMVENGKATLTGTTYGYRAKMAAEQDAWSVSGINAVDNQIQVEYLPDTNIPSDDEIFRNLKTALTWDTSIDTEKITFDVIAGIVTLRGTVDAYWKKAEAEDIAYGIAGVVNVINELGVVPTKQVDDERIAIDVETALERNVNVNVEDLDVTVEDSRVTLSGTVPNWLAWQAAYNTALYTGGVIDVIDRLSIRNP